MKEFHVISLGAGVQSTVMALMACTGELTPMPWHAIFADTQAEPQEVYRHLEWLTEEIRHLTKGEMSVHIVTAGDLYQKAIGRMPPGKGRGRDFVAVPLFTENGGMGRRQCTREYKIAPIHRKTKELMGVKKRGRMPKDATVVRWIGITRDEASRMKVSREPWARHYYPLAMDKEFTRRDCKEWFQYHYGDRTLPRSACVFCPFKSDAEWRYLRDNSEEDFRKAVEFDENIRRGSVRKVKQYVHSSRVPLAQADIRSMEDRGQLNLFNNECEGMCGV